MEKNNTLKDKFMENIKKMESNEQKEETTTPKETKTSGVELYKLDSKTIQIRHFFRTEYQYF